MSMGPNNFVILLVNLKLFSTLFCWSNFQYHFEGHPPLLAGATSVEAVEIQLWIGTSLRAHFTVLSMFSLSACLLLAYLHLCVRLSYFIVSILFFCLHLSRLSLSYSLVSILFFYLYLILWSLSYYFVSILFFSFYFIRLSLSYSIQARGLDNNTCAWQVCSLFLSPYRTCALFRRSKGGDKFRKWNFVKI